MIPSSYATQVLIIEFEIINNSLEMLHATIDVSGLNQYVYRRSVDAAASGKYEWPTLESLIVDNTHLVFFAHGNGMDSSCASVVCPEGMFYTFNHFQETNWNDDTCDSRSKVFLLIPHEPLDERAGDGPALGGQRGGVQQV